jgi:hypothetical protein
VQLGGRAPSYLEIATRQAKKNSRERGAEPERIGPAPRPQLGGDDQFGITSLIIDPRR